MPTISWMFFSMLPCKCMLSIARPDPRCFRSFLERESSDRRPIGRALSFQGKSADMLLHRNVVCSKYRILDHLYCSPMTQEHWSRYLYRHRALQSLCIAKCTIPVPCFRRESNASYPCHIFSHPKASLFRHVPSSEFETVT